MSFLKINSLSLHGLFNRVLNLNRTEFSIIPSRFNSINNGEPQGDGINQEIEKIALEIIGLKKEYRQNGYIYFMRNFVKSKEIYKIKKPTEVMREVATKWKAADPIEILKYKDDAKQGKEKCLAKINRLLKTLSSEEKVKIENAIYKIQNRKLEIKKKVSQKKLNEKIGKPIKPPSSWCLFLQDQDRGDAGLMDFIAGSSAKWKQLPAQEKEYYENANNKLGEEYQRKMKNWEEERIHLGEFDYVRKKTLNAYNRVQIKKE